MVFTNDKDLTNKLRMIADHGQATKYYDSIIGVNSRLDTFQAAILDVKIKYLDEYAAARRKAAKFYDSAFREIEDLQMPVY